MTEEQAIELARRWVKIRLQVRHHLIEAARRRVPQDGADRSNNEVRKLYAFPADLSEQRLLHLIDNGVE